MSFLTPLLELANLYAELLYSTVDYLCNFPVSYKFSTDRHVPLFACLICVADTDIRTPSFRQQVAGLR